MANAYRDQNNVPTLIAVSIVDGQTPVRLWADPVTHRLLVDSTGGTGSSGFQQPVAGTPDGSIKVFVWLNAPNSITVDQGRTMQKVSSDGTVNWTGTTTTTLTLAPNFDIFSTS